MTKQRYARAHYGKHRNHQDARVPVTVFFKDGHSEDGYLDDDLFDYQGFELASSGIRQYARWENVDRVEVRRP